VYLDEARDAVLSSTVGPFREFAWVIAHVSMDYKREIVQGAREVVVRSRIAAVGRTSVTFEQEVLGPDGEVALVCKSVLVAWDRDARASRPIDERERALLTS
jgi:acyl-CoA thioesterase FadM